MRPTIVDVARIAGVSPTTVSRVINGKTTGFAEKTRQKVLKVVEQLAYIPDHRARGLRGGKTGVIGLIIPNLTFFFHDIACILSNVCASRGYGVLVCSSEDSSQRQAAHLDYLVHQAVDGVVIISERIRGQQLYQIMRKDIPVVVLDEQVRLTGAPAVLTDYREAASLATQQLINLGHTRIAYVQGKEFVLSVQDRFQGYRDALQRNGLKLDPRLIKPGDFSYESGYRAGRQLLEEAGSAFTGVVSCSDFMALGIMGALQDQNKRIPEDYSVIGIDDLSVSELYRPRLSSVAPPSMRLVTKALDMIERWPEDNDHVVYSPRLVMRDSCGGPSGALAKVEPA